MNAVPHRERAAPAPDAVVLVEQVGRPWGDDILGQLTRYIAIPAKSPAFKRSLRLPLVDAAGTVQVLKPPLENNAPDQAHMAFEPDGAATGWNAPAMAGGFEQAAQPASRRPFGAPCGDIGQGGTIPLMNMLSEGFPSAPMRVCGVFGPRGHAHGLNGLAHVPYAKRLTAAVAEVIARTP